MKKLSWVYGCLVSLMLLAGMNPANAGSCLGAAVVNTSNSLFCTCPAGASEYSYAFTIGQNDASCLGKTVVNTPAASIPATNGFKLSAGCGVKGQGHVHATNENFCTCDKTGYTFKPYEFAKCPAPIPAVDPGVNDSGKCDAGTTWVDGKCVKNDSSNPQNPVIDPGYCAAPKKLVNGVCTNVPLRDCFVNEAIGSPAACNCNILSNMIAQRHTSGNMICAKLGGNTGSNNSCTSSISKSACVGGTSTTTTTKVCTLTGTTITTSTNNCGCSAGQELFKDQCVSQCSPSQVRDSSTGACGCASGQEPDSSANSSVCVAKCAAGTHLNSAYPNGSRVRCVADVTNNPPPPVSDPNGNNNPAPVTCALSGTLTKEGVPYQVQINVKGKITTAPASLFFPLSGKGSTACTNMLRKAAPQLCPSGTTPSYGTCNTRM